jgi:hypothetical protein
LVTDDDPAGQCCLDVCGDGGDRWGVGEVGVADAVDAGREAGDGPVRADQPGL